MIGHCYKYQYDDTVYELVEVTGFIYRFKCGHWVTDLIFSEMIHVNKQLELF